MSLTIEHIVLHQLQRKSEDHIELYCRDHELEAHAGVLTLISDINRIYHTKNKAYGVFMTDSLFAKSVRELRKGNQNFVNFSQGSTQQLRNELLRYSFTAGGTVIFCMYRYLANTYLLVALLSSRESSTVSAELDIDTASHLDIEHADIIARLDLTEWESDSDSKCYLTFMKGRIGRKVADFFMDYLGAEPGLDPKKQSEQMVQAVDAYCTTLALENTEKRACLRDVYEYCQRQLNAGEEIRLTAVDATLPKQEEKHFLNFIAAQAIPLEETFPASRASLKGLKKFSGSGGGISLSFDISLLGDRIQWDAETDTLTVIGTPPNLRDQLQRHLKALQPA